MSQRNNPERYSRPEKSDPQEHYSPRQRTWGRSRQTNESVGGTAPRIASVSSISAVPTARSASLTNAASPAERMAAARFAAAPALPKRAPDDVPALSPARKMGSALQRFSGTGVASMSAVQRQEQRARVITLSLVSVAVVLIVISAFLLFNPATRHPGFGLAQGQSYVTVTSSAVVTLYKSPTPQAATPTPVPVNQPNATATAQPKATATPRPTATTAPRLTPTPTITPTPTATPIPFGAGATVTFTAATKPLTSDGNITACPGCGGSQISDKPFGTQQYFSHGGSTQYSYSTTTYSESVTFFGGSNPDTCLKSPCIYIGHPILALNGETCLDGNEYVRLNPSNGYKDIVSCIYSAYSPYQDFGSQCTSSVTVVITCQTNSTSTTTNHYVVTFAACLSARQNADAQGDTWANNYIASQSAGLALVTKSISHDSESCSPGVNIDLVNVYNFTGSNTTTVSGLAYDPAAAQAQAKQRIDSLVPAGYKPGVVQVCNPTTGPVSGNTIPITCSDSETAVYDWSQTLQAQLQTTLASSGSNRVTQAQAESMCNSFAGVTPGSCTVVINKGSYMPTTGTTIALVIK